MISRLLSKWGDHDVRMASDGPSGLKLAEEFRPEVVLLDIGLPRMDDYEVARRLRAQPEFRQTLLVALTGYGSGEDQRRSRQAGFDAHLVKPPSFESLQDLFAHPKLEKST